MIMKSSAIVRIVAWSIIAVLLTGVLLCGIYGWPFMGLRFNWPSSFKFGSFAYGYADADSYSVGAGQADPKLIQEMEVYWDAGGKVEIEVYDGDKIRFDEKSAGELKENEQMRYRVKDGKLTIRYMGSTNRINRLKVESVSAPIEISGLYTDNLELHNVSGNIEVEGTLASNVFTETVSGTVSLSGRFATSVQSSSVSGSVVIDSVSCPEQFYADTVRGEIELKIPTMEGFTARYQTVSGSVNCEFKTISGKDTFTYQDGERQLKLETVSGDISIRKH